MSEAIDAIAFYTSRPPDDIVDNALSACTRAGFEVDEGSEGMEKTGTEEYTTFNIYYDDEHFNIGFNFDGDRPPSEPVLSIRCGHVIKPTKTTDERAFRDRMSAVFELLCRLAVTLDVDYAPLFSPEDRRAILKGRPIAENVEELPRIGVYDQAVVDQFGGLESMFDRPPWYTATLEGNKIVVAETERPWDRVDWQPPTEANFLETGAFADSGERAQQGDHDFEDPFAALETGAIGTDLCVPREKIGPEFPNEDLELVRVRVDEERNLRRLDTGAFVRNVVDDDPGDPAAFMMAMLEDIPTDATPDEPMVSALLKDAIPPAFVRLDDADDETVVTKVVALDIDVAKVDLLITLGRVAQDGDVTDEGLREMERFLEKLEGLDDLEGIEQRIQDRLL